MSSYRNSYMNHSNGYQAQCSYLTDEVVHEGNWLRMSKIKYLDPNGQERTWEAIARLQRSKDADADVVAAIAIYRRMLHYDVLVLVRQYRPAVQRYTIEFPQGILETGETSQAAAVRELKEETGWVGEVTHMSPSLTIDPACSSSTVKYATVKINGDALENKVNKPQPKDGEFIDLIMIPLSELHERLNALTKEGHFIDSRVEAFAIGIQMGLKFAKDAELDDVSQCQSCLPVDGSCVRTGLASKQTH